MFFLFVVIIRENLRQHGAIRLSSSLPVQKSPTKIWQRHVKTRSKFGQELAASHWSNLIGCGALPRQEVSKVSAKYTILRFFFIKIYLTRAPVDTSLV